MAVIRTYPVGEAVSRPAPDVAFQPVGVPAAGDLNSFGGNQARDLQVAGAYMDKASDSLGQIAIREAEQVNEAYVQDLNNQFIKSQQEMLYTGQDAFYRKQGKAALDAAPAATEQLQALQKAMIDQTKNEWQKVRLTRILNGHINEVTNGMSRFVAAQSMEWEKQVKENRIELAASASRTQFNDEGFLNNQVAAVTSTLTAGTGWAPDSDEYKGAEMKARSIVYGQAIDGALDKHENGYAIQLFDKHKDKLDARTQDRLGKAIETTRTMDTGKVKATEYMQGPRENNVGNIRNVNGPGFQTFATFDEGVAANVRNIRSYPKAFNNGQSMPLWDPSINADLARSGAIKEQKGQPLTPEEQVEVAKAKRTIAGRWAPYGDGANDPPNWAKIVGSVAGVDPSKPVDLNNPDVARKIVRGIHQIEWGAGKVKDEGAYEAGTARAFGAQGDIVPVQARVEQNGSLYQDPKKLMLDADTAHAAATRRNNEENAGVDKDRLRSATQSELDRQLAQTKQQIHVEQQRIEVDLNTFMSTGGPNGGPAIDRSKIDPNLWNKLSYQQQQAVDATIKHNQGDGKAQTNWQLYDELRRGLTDDDSTVREKWANEPLWKLKPYLADAEYKQIAGMQDAVRKGDPDGKMSRVRSISQIVDDDGLKPLGIKPNPEPSTSKSSDAWKASRFRHAVQEEITSLEVSQGGKKATDEQVRSIVKRLAARDGATWYSKGTPEYEKPIYDIPAAERQKIKDALKRKGAPVTDELIVETYAAQQEKLKKEGKQ